MVPVFSAALKRYPRQALDTEGEQGSDLDHDTNPGGGPLHD